MPSPSLSAGILKTKQIPISQTISLSIAVSLAIHDSAKLFASVEKRELHEAKNLGLQYIGDNAD